MIERVLLSAIAVTTTWTTAPCRAWNGPGGPKVLFIGIDGLRAGAIKAAKTPNLDGLIENGCMTEAALAGRSCRVAVGDAMIGEDAEQAGIVRDETPAPVEGLLVEPGTPITVRIGELPPPPPSTTTTTTTTVP